MEMEVWKAFQDYPTEETFGPVYERTKRLVYTVCFRILRNPEDAADAFQSVYCRLLGAAKAQESLPADAELDPFIGRLAVREASNLRDRRQRRQKREVVMEHLPEPTDSGISPDQIAASREMRNKIETLISLLPEKYRLPLLLHYFDGMTQAEIARLLEIPEGTIRNRVSLGLKQLRPMMQRARLGEATVMLGAIFTGSQLLSPPAALGASAVYAQASVLLASGGVAAATAGGSAAVGAGTGAGATSLVSAGAAKFVAVILGLSLGIAIVPGILKSPRKAKESRSASPSLIVDASPQKPQPQESIRSRDVGPVVTSPEPSVPPQAATSEAAVLEKQLGGAERFLAHVSTDKPIYKAGEDVYVRAVVVDAMTQEPLIASAVAAQIEVISPKGDTVARGGAALQHGSLGYKWPIEEGVAGGDYKIKVSFPVHGLPPAEREFNIRAYRQRRLRTQIEFGREGYGPADEVRATLEASRSEGGIPTGAKATVVARVDEEEAWRGTTTIGADGFATVNFKLPDTIERGEGTLSFAIEDGGVVETAAKTIPILVATVDLKAYPEGGDLTANIENRVYFEAIAPNGRPADITAALVDAAGKSMLTAKTEHEGRGSFSFIPQFDTTYTLQVVEPWIVTTKIELPRAVQGVALRATKEKYAAGAPIEVEVAPVGDYWLTVSKRDRIVASGEATADAAEESGWTPVKMDLPSTASGVLRVTVFDLASRLPVAERLVYREPAVTMKVEIEPERSSYVPADQVRLMVRTTDAYGKPVPGLVGLTVTDDALLEMVETREQAPRLPVQVYIEPEVRELADAHVYLSDDPKAPRALDLLLGTQGWRRFAFYRVDEFLKEHGDASRRVLAEMKGGVPVQYRYVTPTMWAGTDLFIFSNALEFDEFVADIDMDGYVNVLPFDKGGEVEINGIVLDPNVVPKGAEDKAPQDAADRPAAPEPGMKPPAVEPEDPADQQQLAAGPFIKIQAMGEDRNQHEAPILSCLPDLIVADYEWIGTTLVVFREYAHKARADRQPNDRVDFTETLYWNAGIATGEDGETSVTFDLSDSVTSFRAMADAYTEGGAFTAADCVVESRRPFYAEVKAPLEVTAGDRIDMPVMLVNETDEPMEAGLVLSAAEGVTIGEHENVVALPAHSRKRVIVPATIAGKAGPAELLLSASAGAFSDNVTRRMPAAPLGFPISLSYGGLLEGEVSHKVSIPESLANGSLAVRAVVYPTPLANLTEALEALIRDPNGCFEQTSSTNYPLVMAMQYFDSHQGVDPELKKSSREKLAAGYRRLVGFECKQKGYEWFGGDPGHEALTAYGLLEFADMSSVQPVDEKMLERTREWLLARRDGKGGFQRNARSLDSFGGAPEDITNAYITWALAVAGEKDIETEIEALKEGVSDSNDPYLLALAAGSLIESGRKGDAAPLLKRLASMQDEDGSLKGAKTTITRSGGQSLLIESTSLAILAWLGDGGYAANVERAMKWLAEACEGGRFGSTQSTVLALKAIVEYDKSRARPLEDGEVSLFVDGVDVQTIPFKKDTQGAIEFIDVGGHILPGKHNLALEMKGGSPMPYSLAVEYHAEKLADSATCPLELTTRVTQAEVREGDPVEVVATLRNTSDEGQPMTMAIIGLPGGLEPRHEQLKESVEAGKFSFYEVRGRDVAIYYRDLAPNAEHKIVISCIATAPGVYTGPASRAYLYYTPEEKKWADPVKVTVSPTPAIR